MPQFFHPWNGNKDTSFLLSSERACGDEPRDECRISYKCIALESFCWGHSSKAKGKGRKCLTGRNSFSASLVATAGSFQWSQEGWPTALGGWPQLIEMSWAEQARPPAQQTLMMKRLQAATGDKEPAKHSISFSFCELMSFMACVHQPVMNGLLGTAWSTPLCVSARRHACHMEIIALLGGATIPFKKKFVFN